MTSYSFTHREFEVLDQISLGMTTREILQSLFLSSHTMEFHRKNLLLKMDAKNTAGLVRRTNEYVILKLQSNAA